MRLSFREFRVGVTERVKRSEWAEEGNRNAEVIMAE